MAEEEKNRIEIYGILKAQTKDGIVALTSDIYDNEQSAYLDDILNDLGAVQANPVTTDADPRLESLKIGDKKYAIGGVEANPETSSSDPRLNGLKIGKKNYIIEPVIPATDEDIDSLFSRSITVIVTNGSKTPDSATDILPDQVAVVKILPADGYALPETITVSGATLKSYDSATGKIEIIDAILDVIISVECVAV